MLSTALIIFPQGYRIWPPGPRGRYITKIPKCWEEGTVTPWFFLKVKYETIFKLSLLQKKLVSLLSSKNSAQCNCTAVHCWPCLIRLQITTPPNDQNDKVVALQKTFVAAVQAQVKKAGGAKREALTKEAERRVKIIYEKADSDQNGKIDFAGTNCHNQPYLGRSN